MLIINKYISFLPSRIVLNIQIKLANISFRKFENANKKLINIKLDLEFTEICMKVISCPLILILKMEARLFLFIRPINSSFRYAWVTTGLAPVTHGSPPASHPLHMGHHRHRTRYTWVTTDITPATHGSPPASHPLHMGHHRHHTRYTWVTTGLALVTHGSPPTSHPLHMGHHRPRARYAVSSHLKRIGHATNNSTKS